MTRVPWVVRLYGWLLALMPPDVKRADGAEIRATFARLMDSGEGADRVRVVLRSFARLPVVIVLEWWDRWRWGARPETSSVRRPVMEGVTRSLRHSVRRLARTPAFTLTTVLLLGVGIGGVTMIFTLFDHVLLRPMPYGDAERLVEIQEGAHSGPVFEDFRALGGADAWGGVLVKDANLTGEGRPERLRLAMVTRDFLGLFGARPRLGRLFVEDDYRAPSAVVLSEHVWRQSFGGDAEVVGRTVTIDGAPHTVVGVMDGGFVEPEALTGRVVDVWRPVNGTTVEMTDRSYNVLSVVARLRPEVSVELFQAELDAMARRRAEQFPDMYAYRGEIRPLPAVPLQEATVGGVRQGLGLLLAAVTLLLLVACMNVAHLFLARGLGQVRELAMRRALGARTGSLAGTLALESLLIGGAGAAVGVALAMAGLKAFVVLNPDTIPRSSAVVVDVRVLLFAAALGAATALLFGMLPVLRLLRADVSTQLRGRGRGQSENRRDARLRGTLVVTEVALSLMLVVQAGAVLESFGELHRQELGFRTEGVWTIPLNPMGLEDGAEWARRMEAVRVSLAEVPGVSAATFAVTMPLQYVGGGTCCWKSSLTVAGREDGIASHMHAVDTDYFDLLGLEMRAGRGWTRDESDDEPVPVVISEPLAIDAFGSAGDALGRELNGGLRGRPLRVMGVVADNRHYGPERLQGEAAYLPASAQPFAIPRANFAIAAAAGDRGLAQRLREAIWAVDPDLPVPTIRTLDESAGAATARARFEAILYSTFGAVALLLVAGGLYGTLLYAVGRRRRELGIRLALGDEPGRLERRVLRQGLALAVFGCLAGVGGVWAIGRILASRSFELHSGDPLTFAGAMTVLLVVAAAASWIPGRRAARTDPMDALRAE